MRPLVGAGDLIQLRATLTTLLTPLDDPSAAAWRRRVAIALQQLIGADGCAVMLSVPGEPHGIGVGQWEGLQSVVDIWTDRYLDRNPLDVRRQRLGARVWTRFGLMPPADFYRSAYYNEWCRPSGNLDSAGMSAPIPGDDKAEGTLFVTADAARRFDRGGREEQLLKLLQPAFAAGIALIALTRSWQDALGSALDLAGTPLAIVRPDGEFLHATPALLTLVAAQPTGGALLIAAQALARDVGTLLGRTSRGSLPAPATVVQTPGGDHVLRATLVQVTHMGAGPLVLVAVTGPAAAAPTAAALAGRFGLTAREAQVTLRVARGERDRAIAQALGISHHTVRRHVEHVLAKLGLRTRAAVAGVIHR
ncbi:MAG TPA: helix-turn-helix transcriptional regulator [Gemmatimonadales bacterium]|nr:helix-turn-helix transcriptional regulator [Gemmatimonadales bacterium]